jgi:hypothetical protein
VGLVVDGEALLGELGDVLLMLSFEDLTETRAARLDKNGVGAVNLLCNPMG